MNVHEFRSSRTYLLIIIMIHNHPTALRDDVPINFCETGWFIVGEIVRNNILRRKGPVPICTHIARTHPH